MTLYLCQTARMRFQIQEELKDQQKELERKQQLREKEEEARQRREIAESLAARERK